MSLKRIPTDVEKKISASSDIKSYTKAIEELVYNAFDAKSTSIAVRVFIQEGSIQVVDNGTGITNKNMKFLGHRYFTSKYRSDLQTEHYGYRGMSLASIVEVSQKVKITSRYHDENTDCTFTKTFVEGKKQDITETFMRPSKGTTVIISGFLYNYHIQKKSISTTTEISNVKAFLERISLVYCNSSISLRDDSINEIVFQINKHRDVTQTLQTLYQIRPQDIQELQVEKNEYKIHGYIEKAIVDDDNYHLIYLNGRFIRNTKLQSSIDKRIKINNCNRITKSKRIFDDTEKITKENVPSYFIFIKCPQNDYEINQNNEDTCIEFKNWDKIDKLVEKLIQFYKGELKVTEIKNNCKKISNEFNEDTRKQVTKIMQRFLDNSARRPKRLRLKTGVIGKNATRKDNKISEKLSISNIVSKQFKSRFNKFYKNNPPEDKNEQASRLLSIESNTEINLQIRNKKTPKEVSNAIQLKENWKIRPSHLRISQDPLNKKFKYPTNTILKRCDMLLEGLKDNFMAYKATDHIKYATSKTVQTQIDVRFKNQNVTHKEAFIKTSHDLIKTIFDCGEVLNVNFSKRVKDSKKKTIKNFIKKNYTLKKYCNQRVCSNDAEYSKEFPPNKRKRFITERSSSNSHTAKTLTTAFHRNEKNKKEIRKNVFRKGGKHKADVNNLFQKKLYTEQSVHTIETFESHSKNNVVSNFKSLGDRSYISHKGHRFISETLSSKVKTYNASEIITSAMENTTKYDGHKTYTIEISESKRQVVERQFQKANNNKTFSDVPFDDIFSDNDNVLFVNQNPLAICETVLHDSIFENNYLREDLCDNVYIKSNNDLSPKYYNDREGHIQDFVSKRKINIRSDHTIITNNNKNINKSRKRYVEEQHKALSPDISETLIQDSITENYVLGDNYVHNIKSKNGFNPKSNDDCILDVSINEENNHLRLDTRNAYSNTNLNKTSKDNLQEQLKTANSLSIFETNSQNNGLENNYFEEDFYDDVLIKDTENYDRYFLCSLNEKLNRLYLNTIETANIGSKVSDLEEPTGTMYKKPHVSTDGFKLHSRHNFIPKGMSQITEFQYTKVAQLNELNQNYYNTDIYDNFATNLQTFSEVLESGVQILTNFNVKGIGHIIKPSSNVPIFNDQSLKDAKVIGQVDNKFIGAKVTGRFAKVNIISEFLVLFDQHAVDERIRLENNLADYFDGSAWNSVYIDTVPIKLPKDIITYLHNYKEKFSRFGLEWTCSGDVVSIKSIPQAILGKHSRQIDVIMKAVKSLISEEVEAIKSLRGNVSLHPKSIMNLVSSEACRYAIKFGDILQKSECEGLLSALSTCKLPFQCAHGRPVMAVMMELPTKSYEYKINMESVKRMKLKLAKY